MAMGNMARANVTIIPISDRKIGPEAILDAEMTPACETPMPQARGSKASAMSTPVTAEKPGMPKQDPVPTRSPRDIVPSLLRLISRERITRALFAGVSIGVLFLIWYLGTRYRFEFYIRFKNVPTPAEVLKEARQVGLSGKYLVNIAISVQRIVTGFLIAVSVGVPLGLTIGRYQRVRDLFMPAIEILRPIPAIAWVPMSIMLWPSNEAAVIFITVIGAFFPILLNTIQGVHSLDGVLIRAARCLGATEVQLFCNVILPGALPYIFTGLAVGMGVAWVSLIAAEMISGQFGVGYFTWEAYSLVDYPAIMLGMITIGLLGLACSGIIRMIGVLLMPWLAFASRSKQ
jgi:NitT/TauT family transport system permease protein